MSQILSVSNLHAGYGESEVLQGISFDVGAGEVICLLGANGAGKTTTMAALTGLIRSTAGQVRFAGEDLLSMPPHLRVERGVTLSPEGRKVFPNLTVEENLFLGSFNRKARSGRAKKLAEVYDLFPRLAERREQKAGLMSGGEQQMLAIGRAIMANPKLLLLDEPSLGLAPKIVMLVFEAIRRIARSSISILLVEQNTQAALSVASRGYVLSAGRIVFSGNAGELRDSREMKAAFIGGEDGVRV